MTIETIITWLLGLWGALRGRSNYRAKLDVRSEKAIADERKNLDKLWARMAGIDSELKGTIHRLVRAKKDGDTVLERRLGDKRDVLFRQFQDAKQKYEELKDND